MTSKDILSGTDWMTATSREMLYMARIEEAKTTEDACYETAEAVMRYFRDQDSRSEERSTIAERMTAWLHSHYHEKASLNAASKAIGASVSSIVQHLRKDMGKSSKEILKEIRVSQAKKLLATTEMEISEIAQLCGFSDQSHFTKQFKYAINLTPGEFRRLLHFGKEEI
jgi:AraC-like DNA-binding protein